MSAHVTEVSCHSISGLRKSYNYMCSRTYYLLIGALSLPSSNLLRLGSEVRSNFPLPYKHGGTLSYTYKVLISPIDKSSEQRNNKTKQNTNISMRDVAYLRLAKSSSQPRHGVDVPHLGMGLRCCVGSLRNCVGPREFPDFVDFFPFPRKPTKIKRKLVYSLEKHLPSVF